jgi:uncharacterized OB-fold protein
MQKTEGIPMPNVATLRDGGGDPVLLAGRALKFGADGQAILVGGRCADCGAQMFPQPPVCPTCMSENILEEEMPRCGKLYSYTVVYVGPKKWFKPFAVGYIDLPNGVRVFSHLLGTSFSVDEQVMVDVADVGVEADGAPMRTFVFRQVED